MSHHLTKKQRERLAQQAHQDETDEMKHEQPANGAGGFIARNAIGFGLGLLLGGMAVFLPFYSIVTIAFIIGGAALLAWGVWKEVVVPRSSRRSRIVFQVTCALCLGLFIAWLLWPVALQLSVQSKIPQYGPGSNYKGIPWSDDYAQLDLTFTNSSRVDYDNFDVDVSTDLVFEGLKQVTGIVNCAVAPVNKGPGPSVQKMSGGVPSGPVDDNPDNYAIITEGPNGEQWFTGDRARSYRIRCDKLAANSDTHFVAAISVINPVGSKQLFGPARVPKWCTAKGRLTQLAREREVVISDCKMGGNCTP